MNNKVRPETFTSTAHCAFIKQSFVATVITLLNNSEIQSFIVEGESSTRAFRNSLVQQQSTDEIAKSFNDDTVLLF
jgi:hypothetical protein